MFDGIDGPTLAAIAGMAAVTYGLRAGGLLLADRLPSHGRWARALDRLPGIVLIALVAPAVRDAGMVGLAAAAAVAALYTVSRSPLAAMVGGVVVVALGRQMFPGL